MGSGPRAKSRLGGIVISRSVRVGGYETDEAVAHSIRSVHQLAIGSRTAEAIKLELGSAMALPEAQLTEVGGRHLATGLPTAVQLHSDEVTSTAAEEGVDREVPET